MERAKNGEFGEIFHVDAQMNTYLPKEKRQWMEAFGEMVRGEKENPYTYDYELALYKLVLKCCQM